jgi:uncharacterized membrane protein
MSGIIAFIAIYIAKTELQNTILTWIIGSAILVFCVWLYFVKAKKASERRYREQVFQNHMRLTLRNQWH